MSEAEKYLLEVKKFKGIINAPKDYYTPPFTFEELTELMTDFSNEQNKELIEIAKRSTTNVTRNRLQQRILKMRKILNK